MWLCTKSQIACTRAQPGGVLPNSVQAMSRQLVGLAIAAAQQEDQRSCGRSLDGMLRRVRHDRIGQSGVRDDRVGDDAQLAGRRDEPAADIAEHVAINRERAQRRDADQIGHEQIGAREGCTFSISTIGVGAANS